MNFETAAKSIDKEYAYSLLANYMKEQWGVSVGYRQIPLNIARMRKRLADWQADYDCNDTLCQQSKVISKTVESSCCPSTYSLVAKNAGFVCSQGVSGLAHDIARESCQVVSTKCCPEGYMFAAGTFSILTSTGQKTYTGKCVQFNQPSSAPAIVIDPVDCVTLMVESYGRGANPGECLLNPPLTACKSSCCHEWTMNVTDLVLNTFTR